MLKKVFLLLLICFLFPDQSISQHFLADNNKLKVSCHHRIISRKPDNAIKESSGLVYFDHGLWTLNDGGNTPILYQIDTTSGKILRRVYVANTSNNDWEALTQDNNWIYIGDFGNNFGKRRDLQILRIAKKDMKRDTLIADIIYFSYAIQNNFRLPLDGHNFDCEAFCALSDNLYLFSKNWANHKTYEYVVPKFPGKYIVRAVDSFNRDGLITDADYDKENRTLVLLGYNIKKFSVHSFLWVFKDFNGTRFFSCSQERVNLHLFLKQTEGITHNGNTQYYFTNEMVRISFIRIRPKLYRLKMIFG